jgi:hypothetical protein
MAVSRANRILLERKFGRSLPAGDPKVTLSVSGICKLLDDARAEGAAMVREKSAASNLDEVIGRAMDRLNRRGVF